MMKHISHRIHRLINAILCGAAMTVTALCLHACSADEPVDAATPDNVPTEQELVINLSAAGDRLTTRAGRPLQSTAPGQGINHVTLYVLNDAGIVLQKQIDEHAWAHALDYGKGKQLSVAFRASEGECLPEGDYTLFALGFSKDTDYSLQPNPLRAVNAISGSALDANKLIRMTPTEFQNQFSASLQKAGLAGEEIFAGKALIHAGQDGSLSVRTAQNNPAGPAVVVLNRQVAGVLGYFTNIPAQVNGISPTLIRLIASNKSNRLHFNPLLAGETGDEEALPGEQTPAKIHYVVNGTQDESFSEEQVEYGSQMGLFGYTVYEIRLADFFPLMKESGKTFADCDVNHDGHVGLEDVRQQAGLWTNPRNTSEHPQSLVKGSVYGASFVLPFEWKSSCPTFELQLIHRDAATGHDTYLKTWNVSIAQSQLNPLKPQGNTSTGVVVPIEGDYSTSCFHVYRNHLYALGRKTAEGDGTPLEQMDENSEKPLDLSRYLDLVIAIQKQWSQSESMEIN